MRDVEPGETVDAAREARLLAKVGLCSDMPYTGLFSVVLVLAYSIVWLTSKGRYTFRYVCGCVFTYIL